MAGGHLNIGHNLTAFTSRSGAYPAGRGGSRTSLQAAANALVENAGQEPCGWVDIHYTRAGVPGEVVMTVYRSHPTASVKGITPGEAAILYNAGRRILGLR